MMERFDNYLKDLLSKDAEIQAYINAALEQLFIDNNKELFLTSLKKVIDIKGGIGQISQKTNINRQHLYRMLSSKGNPTFNNISSLLGALGLKLKVDQAA